MLRRHLSAACPTTFHRHEDVAHVFCDENLAQFAAMWWEGFVFWESDIDAQGDAFVGTTFKVTKISHAFPTELVPEQSCKDFLIETSALLGADYSFLHVFPREESEIRPDDEMICGITALRLPNSLPGLPWGTCYGKRYADFFGKNRLLSLPVAETREVGPDIVYCQLTDRMPDTVENPSAIDEQRRAVYDLLGRDAFFDPQHPDRLGRAPEFKQPLVLRPSGA
jgi:hypothetical protein